MRRIIYFLTIILCLSGCTKSEAVGPYGNYLEAAADHCNIRQAKLKWLTSIVTSGSYKTPGANLPAPIRQISLSSYGGGRVFLLDSDVNACSTCPWATLNCDGQPLVSKSSLTPVRDKVIWKSY
jgi:hypothetical protein